MKHLLIILNMAFFLCVGCASPREHYQEVLFLADQSGQLAKAVESNDPEACYQLAYLLLEGLSAPWAQPDNDPLSQPDFAKWLTKAAELGYPQAQQDLGFYLLSQYNTQSGLAWLEKAAQTGNPNWQFQLSRYYCCSNFVPDADLERSFYWALRAAKGGLVSAQSHVGYCYSVGLGVNKDDEKAARWMEKAASADDPYSQNNLAIAYEYGLSVEQSFDRAIYWYERAIKNDFTDAVVNLGVLYVYSAPAPYHNPVKGFNLLKLAAAKDHSRAISVMAECYQYGVGVKRDLKEALYLQTLAHERGYHIASYYLGRMYLNGEGTAKDVKRALHLFNIAAEQESWGGAACAIGDIYLKGIGGINRDYDQALIWYTRAARQNNQRAMYQLGVMYENGLGVAKNQHSALGWYRKALSLNKTELQPSYTEQSLSDTDPVANTTRLAQKAITRLSK